MILNLIKNAEDVLIETNIQHPYIHIKTYDDNHYSYLEVKDNGMGIPQDILDKIFDPYFSTKTKKDGTGLGLYMSKIIIEDHCGGKLSVFNRDDGAEDGGENPLFDPTQIITIRSTGEGGNFAIPVTEPISITDLLAQANLTVSQSIEYWVDGVAVGPEHTVAPGTTVTAVGMVKGG